LSFLNRWFRALQNSNHLGVELDEAFFGQKLFGKLQMAVSGCSNCCVEPLYIDA